MDDGFDPCEYVWSHEMAMRRLLSLLRHSQAYCTDNECLTELPGSNINSSDGNLLLMVCCFFLTLIFFVVRSFSLRRRDDFMKFHDHDHGSSGDSPPPAELY